VVRDLKHELTLLELRAEQLRLHLGSVCAYSSEARRARSLLAAIDIRKTALRNFLHENPKNRALQ
jgi:hypothetical protein